MNQFISVEQDTAFSDENSVSKVIEEETDFPEETVSSTTYQSFGKFKTADELFKAYTNLEKEFTRKSQRLGQLEKQTTDKENLMTALTANQEQPPESIEKTENSSAIENTETVTAIPFFEQENWQETVTEFLTKNEQAKPYASSISAEILADKDLKQNPKALELAWGRVVAKTYKDPIELAKDKNFLENLVLSSKEMKQKVMEIYLDELRGTQTPKVMGSRSGSAAFASNSKPQSLSDAKKYLEKILTY